MSSYFDGVKPPAISTRISEWRPLESAQYTPAPSLRIAYVIDSLRRDGTQTALIHLVQGLAQRHYQQRVYCLNDAAHPDVVCALSRAGCDPIILGRRALLTGSGIRQLYRAFKQWQPQIVQTFLPYGDLIGRTVARLAGISIIVSSIRARNIEKAGWQLLGDRLTARWADRVVFNAQQAIPFALKYEGVRPEQVVYIPNGVTLPNEPGPHHRTALLRELGLPRTAFLAGMVGRLVPQKGHRYLLQAFAYVTRHAPDAVLLIIGDGPLRASLQHQTHQSEIAERVFFLGERSDVPALLSGLDVYIHASLYEGMPNAVMEAMAASRPVIATAVDGTIELIQHQQTGLLVPPADPLALAHATLYALENPSVMQQLGQAARRLIATHYTTAHMVTAFDSLYQSLVAAKEVVLT